MSEDFEKRGVIEQGRTPPEDDSENKKASEKDLEDHVSRRLADAASDSINVNRN